jgi:starvation-inducible DNA-binding protein
LHLLFDAHYKEQLRLVDVLIDRVRMLGGAARIFAGDLLQSSEFSSGLRGRPARSRLLRELLDAHELILSAAHSGGTSDGQNASAWVRDLAVGQVVLANELQGRSIGELLVSRGDDPSMSTQIAQLMD